VPHPIRTLFEEFDSIPSAAHGALPGPRRVAGPQPLPAQDP
jgi:hypothetical protein